MPTMTKTRITDITNEEGPIIITDEKVGSKFIYRFTISKETIFEFAHASQDFNAIHLDDEEAKKAGFKGIVSHGILGSAVISRVLGTIMPGKGTIFLRNDVSFMAPLYPRDNEYAIEFTIDSREAFKQSFFKVKILTKIIDPLKSEDERGYCITSGLSEVLVK